MSGLIVVQERGGHAESAHEVDAVAVDAAGRVVERIGAPRISTWRSAAKPFQLEASLRILPRAATDALTDEQIAIGAASHWGEPRHLDAVRSILAQFGGDETCLFCGAHPPGRDADVAALIRSGASPSALHNNCSGKHAYMAWSSKVSGWEPDYRPPTHPLQAAIREVVRERTQGAVIDAVVDGCGVPCWVLPIDAMARAWAAVAAGMPAREGDLGRIGAAMNRCWWHFSGTDAIDGQLVRTATRPIVAKVGAEGLMCLAIPDAGVGIALKVATGSDKARAVAVHAVLERWYPGLIPAGADTPSRIVRNWVGRECGSWTDHWN